MRIEHLKNNFEKRMLKTNLQFNLNSPANDNLIDVTEKRLKLQFYKEIYLFYKQYNGLKVVTPSLEIFPLENFVIKNDKLIFGTIENSNKLCFDLSGLNSAGQWNIIDYSTSYIITLTFASFWSNKIWAWIDKKRKIWCEEIYT